MYIIVQFYPSFSKNRVLCKTALGSLRWGIYVGNIITANFGFSPEGFMTEGRISNNSLDFVTNVAIKTGGENIYTIYSLELYKEEKI